MQPRNGEWHVWKGLDHKWRTRPSWLQGPFHKLCLTKLPPDFSTATTAAQIQQLVTLYVVPVVPAKHHITGIEALHKLPSPDTTGQQFRLPPVRVPQQQCLVPGKLLVRRLQGLTFDKESEYWKLTLQRVGSSRGVSWPTQSVRLHALICHARHGPPAEGDVAMHLCANKSCIHPEHIAWETQSVNTLHAWHKHTPVHFPTVDQSQKAKTQGRLDKQARAEARQRAAGMQAQLETISV